MGPALFQNVVRSALKSHAIHQHESDKNPNPDDTNLTNQIGFVNQERMPIADLTFLTTPRGLLEIRLQYKRIKET